MSTLFNELEKQARRFTPLEKASLARILIEELDPSSDGNVKRLWIEESQRRYEAYLRGELSAVSGDDVMSRARSRLIAVAHHSRGPDYWRSRIESY
jgi:Putative addiction module component